MNGMKAKKMWMAGLALLGIGSLALATKKVADDRKLMKTQEELTEIVRDHFSDMGEIATLYVQVYESSLESLVGGVIFEDGRHYTFVYENEDLVYDTTSKFRRIGIFSRKRWQEGFPFCGRLVWRLSLYLSCLTRN